MKKISRVVQTVDRCIYIYKDELYRSAASWRRGGRAGMCGEGVVTKESNRKEIFTISQFLSWPNVSETCLKQRECWRRSARCCRLPGVGCWSRANRSAAAQHYIYIWYYTHNTLAHAHTIEIGAARSISPENYGDGTFFSNPTALVKARLNV